LKKGIGGTETNQDTRQLLTVAVTFPFFVTLQAQIFELPFGDAVPLSLQLSACLPRIAAAGHSEFDASNTLIVAGEEAAWLKHEMLGSLIHDEIVLLFDPPCIQV
jgi:hypothetical protein